MSAPTPLLSVKGIRKTFGKVCAIDHVDFTLMPGEVHALCGGNGAGKSTFLRIVMGFLQPDCGEIRIKGRICQFSNAKQALNAGITIVQQELSMIPDISVAENIFLGQEPRKKLGFVDFKQLNEKAQALLDELDFDIKATRLTRTLSVAEQQLVEIAKALSHSNADIIFFDEPTSTIGEKDSLKLFKAIRKLSEKGKGVIYVSHRMSEIFTICNRYTVFRDGRYICEGDIQDISREKLIEEIVGGELNEEFAKYNKPTDEPLLTINELTSKPDFADVSITVKKGEIVGLYGLVGAGRTRLLDALFGIAPIENGTIQIGEKKLKKHSTRDAIRAGMAYVTEDRKETGLVLCGSVADNTSISSLPHFTRAGILNRKKEQTQVNAAVKAFNVKTPNTQELVQNLSGGNQQKVILAHWSMTQPDVLLLDEPTRGIDVGAKKEIYRYMSEQALTGKCILMVSSELPEIIGMSDRILVFKKGRVVAERKQEEATQTELLNLAS
ncbi:sugar ABC transporter ATP-binding protein [Puniceicoccus vermicola]|uniref:Sugar ABC transporter ATP-binding protein n=1 Tax=Puniceicoccus vermicola TaxID=388746 RepID=A0A7X1E4M1_9BACT|nr:sugar ABC transporter ATP-binding protein [Puniceicoccus vermicola]MBC2602286.1 sugar ABC transporter ATP-binding protein [Puniceicoccus vermicola]